MTNANLMSNTKGKITKFSLEKEARILAKLYADPSTAPIAHYVEYEASANICLDQIVHALIANIKPDRILEELKGDARVMTLRSYGDLHPGMPISKTLDKEQYRQALKQETAKQKEAA